MLSSFNLINLGFQHNALKLPYPEARDSSRINHKLNFPPYLSDSSRIPAKIFRLHSSKISLI